jgi:hypothetical protein
MVWTDAVLVLKSQAGGQSSVVDEVSERSNNGNTRIRPESAAFVLSGHVD